MRNEERNAHIVSVIADKAKNEGRNIIILSTRVDHLRMLNDMMRAEHPEISSDLYIGGDMKDEEREHVAANMQVIFASYPMGEEALDIPRLDTLVLAIPRSRIEQAVGRILRAYPNKKVPTVVDIHDPYSYYGGMWWNRERQYKGWGYKVSKKIVVGNLADLEIEERVSTWEEVKARKRKREARIAEDKEEKKQKREDERRLKKEAKEREKEEKKRLREQLKLAKGKGKGKGKTTVEKKDKHDLSGFF